MYHVAAQTGKVSVDRGFIGMKGVVVLFLWTFASMASQSVGVGVCEQASQCLHMNICNAGWRLQ
jgi:hypothetical protein